MINMLLLILERNMDYFFIYYIEAFDYIPESVLIILNDVLSLLTALSSLYVINVLLILLPVLLSVAFMTIIERKQLAAMQRRVGPNTVGQLNLKTLTLWPRAKNRQGQRRV